MRNYKLILGLLVSGVSLTVLFQNCSGSKFTSSSGALEDVASPNRLVASPNFRDQGTAEYCVDDRVYPQGYQNSCETKLKFSDSSRGDGHKLTLVAQSVKGAGAGLKGCTGPIANYNTGCVNDSEFQLITKAWGSSSYNASSDTYSTSMDVSTYIWPFTKYFTRYILSDGTRTEVIFEPILKSTAAPEPVQQPSPQEVCTKIGKLVWVYTNPEACVGPTPAPAPIGQSCSNQGEKRTNPCGTATCQVESVCQ
jgi:hypothetical protein